MIELAAQLRRDHALLDAALSTLRDIPSERATAELRAMFVGHVDSEAVVLRAALTRTQPPPFVAFLIAQVTAAHLAQERVLDALTSMRPSTPGWRAAAHRLGDLMRVHAAHEEVCVLPALHDELSGELLARLADRYAAMRERQLSGSTGGASGGVIDPAAAAAAASAAWASRRR